MQINSLVADLVGSLHSGVLCVFLKIAKPEAASAIVECIAVYVIDNESFWKEQLMKPYLLRAIPSRCIAIIVNRPGMLIDEQPILLVKQERSSIVDDALEGITCGFYPVAAPAA